MSNIKPGDLKYKSDSIYLNHAEYRHDKKLSEIEYWIIKTFGMMVTCAYRKKKHRYDLHGFDPVRAKDIRSWCYINPIVVCKAINDKWVYDPLRPKMVVALYHDSGQGAHIHLQVHENTRKR